MNCWTRSRSVTRLAAVAHTRAQVATTASLLVLILCAIHLIHDGEYPVVIRYASATRVGRWVRSCMIGKAGRTNTVVDKT